MDTLQYVEDHVKNLCTNLYGKNRRIKWCMEGAAIFEFLDWPSFGKISHAYLNFRYILPRFCRDFFDSFFYGAFLQARQ